MLITTDDVPCMLIACLIKNEYGWKVGPEYMHAKPADGMTILNYLCFRADLIDAAAPEIGRLLVEAGASLERDDEQVGFVDCP